jgi:shikimate kinase
MPPEEPALLSFIDPRLQPSLRATHTKGPARPLDGLARGQTVVLAGHRAAGKTTLLPHLAKALGRSAIDLDQHLAQTTGRDLKQWVATDQPGFRQAERAAFASLPPGVLVAVGGGFLAHHASALTGCLVVEVPISFETYVERLAADTTRPRLRPDLPFEEELATVFREREALHRAARPTPLVELLWRLPLPARARRVVTLPPNVDAFTFAATAARAGADLLELRTDLCDASLDTSTLARTMPLLVAERGQPLPLHWLEAATLVDRELDAGPVENTLARRLTSHHATVPLTPQEAAKQWASHPAGGLVKHIEPLGSPADAVRLRTTRALLAERFGDHLVSVLPTGPLATAWRASLADDNALDYLRIDDSFSAAAGQRLLADAVRSAPYRGRRLALLGNQIAHAMTPRLHPQPVDRLECPADSDVAALIAGLAHTHHGLAVTAPFKKAVASAVNSQLEAVNTLWRTEAGWAADSTDDVGAETCLRRLGQATVTVLGTGGVLTALQSAAQRINVTLHLRRRDDDWRDPVTGAVVWTWPPSIVPPAALRFAQAQVAIIAYGNPARLTRAEIHARGGQPINCGPAWLIAQARAQRQRWEARRV